MFKEMVKKLFQSRRFLIFCCLIFWLAEFFFLRNFVEKNAFSEAVLDGIKICGGVGIVYCLYYWFREKKNTELWIYSIFILEFVLFQLYRSEVFWTVVGKPIWILFPILVCYIVFRVLFPFHGFFCLVGDICSAWKEVQAERKDEAEQRRNKLKKDRERKENEKKLRNNKNREKRKNRWKKISTAFFAFPVLIRNLLEDILEGVKSPEISQNPEGKGKESIERNKGGKIALYIVFGILAVLFLVAFFIMSINLFKEKSGMLEEFDISREVINFIKNAVSLSILVVFVVMLFMTMANVFIIVSRSVLEIFRHSFKQHSKEDTNYIGYIWYSFTILTVCVWLYHYWPLNWDEFVTKFSSGDYIVYPIILALLSPFFMLISGSVKQGWAKDFLDKEEVKDAFDDIQSLVVDVFVAAINYLKYVSADFLMSIKDLADDDELIDDIEEE